MDRPASQPCDHHRWHEGSHGTWSGSFRKYLHGLLQYELARAGVRSATQVGLPVIYTGVKLELGYRIDLLAEDLVVVEIKSVEAVSPSIMLKSFRTSSSVANPSDCL